MRSRAVHPRHEVRLGSRELALWGVAVLAVCAFAFGGGILVGRGLMPGARTKGADAPPASAEPRGATAGGPGAAGKPASARTEERLTFYKTLTAPTVEVPVVGTPAAPVAVEERLVPREEPAAPPATRSPASPAPERRVTAAAPRPAPAPKPTGPAAVDHPSTPAPAAGEPQLWTVQVSSFRSRALADELRARLVARGFDAYLVSAATEEGRVRYRVRVGAYASRGEADRVAGELRNERNLNPFVTPKSR